MSVNVPERLSKQEYNGLLNGLQKYDLTKYTRLIRENYKKPKGETEYSLKENIEEGIEYDPEKERKLLETEEVIADGDLDGYEETADDVLLEDDEDSLDDGSDELFEGLDDEDDELLFDNDLANDNLDDENDIIE